MSSARRLVTLSAAVCVVSQLSCSAPSGNEPTTVTGVFAVANAVSGSPTVSATVPADGPRQTTLDVTVNGTGFDQGATATFPLNGVDDPRVHVNSTRFVSTSKLVANLSIAANAPLVKYDVAVVNRSGKKGIGTEMFTVTLQAEVLVAGDFAYSVNASGVAAGRNTVTSSCPSSLVPMLWKSDGTKIVLPTGTHCAGTAWKINAAGAVTGQLFSPPGTALWLPQPDGSYVLQDLGPTPEGTLSRNTGAFNDAGDILGWYNNAQIYWRTSTVPWTHMIAPPGATDCAFSRGINNLGAIAGRCTVGGIMNGYYWQNHSTTPVMLPRPAGTTNPVFPDEMNDAGVIIGYISGSPNRALKWTPSGSAYTVQYLPDAGGGSQAYSIASDGTISGSLSSGFVTRAVFWPTTGGYQLLGYSGTATTGEAWEVVVGANGKIILSGNQGNSQALRWRYPF